MKLASLNNLPEVGVSHNPEIKKKVLIKKGEIPKVTQFGRITFKPGQIASSHTHPDMYEVFNVEMGEGKALIDGTDYKLAQGVCLTVEPGEEHEVKNTGESDLIITILGVEI